ncbi:MAG: bifunctional riboflavin kinase/FAD synthetase [Alphaproteobacteria bacterium]|nr:bifunctional riboflavin kinase/FAD synthetase [Alphaproteobacteria bacterium]
MHIFRYISDLPNDAKIGVIALGNFDGIHLGHQKVLEEAKSIADKLGSSLCMMTFEPHPRSFFAPDGDSFLLTTCRNKAGIIEKIGFSDLYIQKFDADFANMSPEKFVIDILVKGLEIKHVITGWNYVFGKDGSGNVALLKQLGKSYGFDVTTVSPVFCENGKALSSTNVRSCIRENRFADAARFLGRYWEIEGKVEEGKARGREMGCPTANISLAEYLHPQKGVYAVQAAVDEGDKAKWFDGVANFGNRPTVSGKGELLEVFLFNFSENIYNKHLRVRFIEYLRREEKFSGMVSLKKQIDIDIINAKEILGKIK